tara:strand:- start:3 stop:539 length:537 start_codon:yes stop_codon:yes gene_type:complete
MNNGKINLIIGPMYSGKSTTLLTRYDRYEIANKKCLLVKYSGDNRYDTNKIITHSRIERNAESCTKLDQLDTKVSGYDVICIDEIQFYEDASIMCEKWANQGIIVEACGLNGDFQRKPFEQISLLIPLSDSIIHMVAVDENNGMDAPFTKRLTDDIEQQLIGGAELYKASCRELFNKK